MNQNKYIRFFFVEPSFRLRLVIVIALFILMGVEKKIIRLQKDKIADLRARVAAVKQIGAMEKKIKFYKMFQETSDAPVVEEKANEIKGVAFLESGVPYVVINNNVYREGDKLGEYTIIKITEKVTEMQNKETQETRYLYLSQ
jgi:hypothetical protein